MTSDDLVALRQLIRQELERAIAPLLRDSLTPGQRLVLRAVSAVYATGETFTTSDLIDAAGARFGQRTELRDALAQTCGLDARRVGILLRQIADSGAVADGMRLVALPTEAWSRRWVLQGVESL